MSVSFSTTSRPAGGDHLVVAGLEAIIDATAGILAAQSLAATLQAMADALAPIVPYTSLVVYEVDWTERDLHPAAGDRQLPRADPELSAAARRLGHRRGRPVRRARLPRPR